MTFDLFPTCFVIGPIGSSFAPLESKARQTYEDALEVLEQVIIPACSTVNLTPIRADSISATGDITEQILRHLRDDDVVIADLTGANPNVMYELGLRHTVDKLTVQIGEFDSLPFDVQGLRTIQFSRSPHGLIQARNKLAQALSIGLADHGELLPATRLWLEVESRPNPQAVMDLNNDAQAVNPADEPGMIDQMATVMDLLPRLTSTTQRIAQAITDIGQNAQGLGPEMEAANIRQASPKERFALIDKLAASLEAPADRLVTSVRDFEETLNQADSAIVGVISYWGRHPGQADDDVLAFFDSIEVLAENSREGITGMSSMLPGLSMMSQLSRTLRRPAGKIEQAVNGFVEAAAKLDRWAQLSAAMKTRIAASEPEVS